MSQPNLELLQHLEHRCRFIDGASMGLSPLARGRTPGCAAQQWSDLGPGSGELSAPALFVERFAPVSSSRFSSQALLFRDRYNAYEHCATTRDSDLHSELTVRFCISSCLKQLSVEYATYPRAPTSIVRRPAAQPASPISCLSCEYRPSLGSRAASMPSSAGQVSSIMITFLSATDQITMSGRSLVATISGGNTIMRSV